MYDSLRLDYDFVKQFFLEQGCELLSPTYTNARTKLKYRCVCNNEAEIVFDSFRKGNRCWECGRKKVKSSIKRLTHEEVAAYFVSQNCELLDTYTRSCIPMTYRCSCKNISKINWNNFKKGKRCQECLRAKRSGPNNYQWVIDRDAKREYDLFKQRCYKLLKISLAVSGGLKDKRTQEMLGYSVDEFKAHIENHPNWLLCKGKRWHVDHIFPMKAFGDYKIYDVKVINSLDNLQPLLYDKNISKGGKYNSVDFEKWLDSKNISF